MAQLLLAVVLALSLFMIPLGLPGTWVMIAAAVGYNALLGNNPIGWAAIIGTGVLALVAEVLEFTLSAKYTRKYGGSRRAEWGALLGGIVGAIIGVPIPIIGSVIGAFVGAFVGAWLAERSRGTELGPSTRVAQGALVGRVVAAGMKTAIGVAIAAWLLFAAIV